jgi:hypothetical protein
MLKRIASSRSLSRKAGACPPFAKEPYVWLNNPRPPQSGSLPPICKGTLCLVKQPPAPAKREPAPQGGPNLVYVIIISLLYR